MKVTWAALLPPAAIPRLRSLRLQPGLEVCDAGGELWLRGAQLDDGLEGALKMLPGARRYFITGSGALLAAGARVPSGRLPAGKWLTLDRYFTPDPQPAIYPGELPGRVPLRLVRSGGAPREPTLLLTDLRAWAAWALGAPEVRLGRLAFAVSSERRVLVRGSPLPPLPGRRHVEHRGIAVPAGHTWSPAVDAEVLEELLRLERGDVAILGDGGTVERVRRQYLLRATRSAVRMTLKEIGHGEDETE